MAKKKAAKKSASRTSRKKRTKKKSAKAATTKKRASRQDDSTRLTPWHACDEFLDPMIRAVKPLLAANPFESEERGRAVHDAIRDVIRIRHSPHYSVARYWLEWNCGVAYADRFHERLTAFSTEVLDWAHRPATWQKNYDLAFANGNEERKQQLQFEKQLIQDSFFVIQSEAVEVYGYLKYLSMTVRQHIAFVNVNSGERFVPTPLQQMMLNLLVGQAMTQQKIMTELNIGSKATFQGNNGKGGMKELMKHGLVDNDRRKPGFFRPDAPPE
jgi:hypothetical protein